MAGLVSSLGLSLVISTIALASPLGCGGQARPVAVKPPVAAVPVLSADAYAHYLKGQVAAFEGRTTQAVTHLRLAQHAAPNEAPIHLELVKFLHVVGSYNEALQEIVHAQKQWPKNPQVWLRAGMLARSLHRYPSALANFQRATSLGEHSEQLAITYGSVLTDSGRFPEARRVYEKALEFHPSSTALHYQLAKLDYQHSEGEQSLNTAIEGLTTLLQQSPFSIESWALLALCHYQQGSVELGDEALRTPFDRSEGSLWVAESLFETLLDLERTSGPQAPSNRLSQVLDRADLLPDTRISIAHWHLRLGNFAIALELSDKLNTFAEASGAIAELRSLALQGLGRNAEAESVLRVIRKISPTYSLMQAMLGRLVARQGRTSEARQVLIDAQKLVSENADLDFAQASVEELAGDPRKSREMLSSILEAHPTSARARYALAEFEQRQGNLDAAISVIQPLVDENPLHFDALNYIGYALIEIPGKRKRARLLLQRAIELAPDNAFILDSFGWLLYHEGKLQQAERFLERAARLSPAQPEAIAHLAELRWRQGDIVQANRLFTRATGLAQSPTMRTKIQSRQHLLNTKP